MPETLIVLAVITIYQCSPSFRTLVRPGKCRLARIFAENQRCSLDVTEWLVWFLDTLHRAVDQAQHALDAVLMKARFWQHWATTPLNERQVKLLNRLLDGFDGRLTTSKWAAIAKCSPDTVLRDISDLVMRGALRKSRAGGRSTSYELNRSSGKPAFRSR